MRVVVVVVVVVVVWCVCVEGVGLVTKLVFTYITNG